MEQPSLENAPRASNYYKLYKINNYIIIIIIVIILLYILTT